MSPTDHDASAAQWGPAVVPAGGTAGYPPGGTSAGSAYPAGAASPAGTAYPAGPTYATGAAYPQQAQPGMGSTLGRGLATGLAVGAGIVAAQEIGHRLLDQHGAPLAPPAAGPLPQSERGILDPDVNPDMGGQDFGLNDTNSWDSGGGDDVGGGD